VSSVHLPTNWLHYLLFSCFLIILIVYINFTRGGLHCEISIHTYNVHWSYSPYYYFYPPFPWTTLCFLQILKLVLLCPFHMCVQRIWSYCPTCSSHEHRRFSHLLVSSTILVLCGFHYTGLKHIWLNLCLCFLFFWGYCDWKCFLTSFSKFILVYKKSNDCCRLILFSPT
jgi:hypothetical protein